MLRAVQRTEPETVYTSKDSSVWSSTNASRVRTSCESSQAAEGLEEARSDYALLVARATASATSDYLLTRRTP